MNGIFLKLIWIVCILKWTIFFSKFLAEGVVHDETCYDNCSCCKNNQCHSDYGWPNVCTMGCIDSRHNGARCYDVCAYNNCLSCSKATDRCDACYTGFYPGPDKDCQSECPHTCLSCTSNTYCTTCKDDYYDKNGSTTCPYSRCPAQCKCSDNRCTSCENGFYDTGNECSKACPSNCVSCESGEACNECEHGFYNGFKFENNAKQISNNCTLKCRERCTECQSYDNCLHCVNGKYGPKCESSCSFGCKDETCDINYGNCICKQNFEGNMCTDCVTGKYGASCSKVCPELCKDNRCNRTTGYCSNGCITKTIIGASCYICTVGMHGTLCNKRCPTNCKAETCNRTTGVCSEGCKDNFKGPMCDTCIERKFGEACDQVCPSQCEHSQCEKETGKCFSCAGNFVGDSCENCKPGFHGQNCNETCSSHCYNATCGMNTGFCNYGCTDNYSGNMCCAPGVNCVKCASNSECKYCDSRYFNYLCDKPCPVNCLDSCDISTGICHDCKMNNFGSFCVRTCPDNCKASSSRNTRICSSFDGTCTFGCKDGFYGSTCYKSCSNICIGNVCKQDSGICDKGCDGSNDDQVCGLGKQSLAPETSTSRTTNIVLATLLALTITALCILLLWILVRKLRSADRQTEATSFQIPSENTLVMDQTPQNEVSEADNSAYEILNTSEGAIEHAYEPASVNAPKHIASPGNTEYVNL